MILNSEIKQTKGFYIPWIIGVNCTFVFYINKLWARQIKRENETFKYRINSRKVL